MVWYVAMTAVVNLGLGYIFALYIERGSRPAVAVNVDDLDADLA